MSDLLIHRFIVSEHSKLTQDAVHTLPHPHTNNYKKILTLPHPHTNSKKIHTHRKIHTLPHTHKQENIHTSTPTQTIGKYTSTPTNNRKIHTLPHPHTNNRKIHTLPHPHTNNRKIPTHHTQ